MDTSNASQGEACSLFGDWSLVERVADTVFADGVELRRVGLTAQRSDGAVATGSAAGLHGDPFRRARFELLERAALLDAMREGAARAQYREDGSSAGDLGFEAVFPPAADPARTRPSMSNAVALGPDLAWALERSRFELVERDRLLRAWYGELDPTPLEIPADKIPSTTSYSWRAIHVPGGGVSEPAVVAVFALPLRANAPLLRGFAARPSVDAALDTALAEALQGLAFLWGEAVPEAAPDPSPTPMFHLDHYLWRGSHDVLADWLCHGHARFGPSRIARPASALAYAELTPSALGQQLRVLRALDPAAAPLLFGVDPACAHLPRERRVHPIS